MGNFWDLVVAHPWGTAVVVVAVAVACLWARRRLRPPRAVKASFDERRHNRGIGPLQVFKVLPFVAGLVGLPLIYVAPTIFGATAVDEKIAAREAMIKCVGGALAIFGLALAAFRSEQSDRDVRVRESQDRTGRYVRCVELLGSMRQVTLPRLDGPSVRRAPVDNDWEPNVEARIGAIQALAQLANEPSRVDDGMARRVRETLAAYIRLQCPREPGPAGTPPLPPSPDEEPAQNLDAEDGGQGGVEEPLRKPYTQDQLAATRAIGRVSWDRREPKTDLSGTDLRLVDWRGGELSGVDLTRSNLSEAKLAEASLALSDLTECTLVRTDLRKSDLSGANFKNAVLLEAVLPGARFGPKTNMEGARLDGAQFWHEEIPKTELDFGLTVKQVLKAENWQTATFSPSFRAELEKDAAA